MRETEILQSHIHTTNNSIRTLDSPLERLWRVYFVRTAHFGHDQIRIPQLHVVHAVLQTGDGHVLDDGTALACRRAAAAGCRRGKAPRSLCGETARREKTKRSYIFGEKLKMRNGIRNEASPSRSRTQLQYSHKERTARSSQIPARERPTNHHGGAWGVLLHRFVTILWLDFGTDRHRTRKQHMIVGSAERRVSSFV